MKTSTFLLIIGASVLAIIGGIVMIASRGTAHPGIVVVPWCMEILAWRRNFKERQTKSEEEGTK